MLYTKTNVVLKERHKGEKDMAIAPKNEQYVEFKFRNKLWRACKNTNGFSLESNTSPKGQEPYFIVEGYYADPELMFKRLVKEHLLLPTNQKEIATTIKKTCEELTSVFVKACYGLVVE